MRTVCEFILTMLLIGILTSMFNIQPVKAEPGTIYIRADGSVDPDTAPISSVDNITYTLTGNIASDGDGVVVERDNIVVDGAGYTVQGTGALNSKGIALLWERSNVTIKKVEIKAFYYGIYLSSSSTNTISENNITNTYSGVWLDSSNNNTISGNNIANNSQAVFVETCNNNTISRNNILSNYERGIALDLSRNNTISGNNIANNSRGVWLGWSSENKFYHNNFIENAQQVHIEESGDANFWDDGYPSGGNYWSDYSGTDVCSSPYQNETGNDGIGDAPYVIDGNNQDNYPLMHPYGSIRNLDTNLTYLTIQSAINAPETLNGHTIFVEAGIYSENVVVNKTICLIGEGRVVTIIDGEVNVTRNNVVISGFAIGGFTTFSSGGRMYFGIRLFGSDCTVNNNSVFYTDKGIGLLNSTNNVISNNVLIANNHNVYLSESSNNTISQNHISSIESEGGIMLMYSGIELDRSSNNTIIQNNITQCPHGIKTEGASSNRIIENNIEYIPYDGFGIQLSSSSNSTIVRNKIASLRGWMPTESYVGISLVCSLNNSIIENDIRENGEGIKLVDSSLNNITDNNLMNNFYGILLQGSQVNSLIRNNITHGPVIITPEHGGSNKTVRFGYGILIRLCYYGSNTLRYNNINGYRYNFGVEGYMDRYVQDVDATNTVDGKPIYYWVNRRNRQIPSDAGYVAIINSTNIRAEGLDLKNNYQGILIAYSNNTIIRQNNITNNYCGIWLDSFFVSSNNTIYHNNFIDNTNQVTFLGAESLENVWDNGYPSGGNYWSDYTGNDTHSGPCQNQTGSDGIGDTLYIVYENNKDNYPLMGMFSDFNTTSEHHVQTICNSTISDFRFNSTAISFDVTGENGTAGFCRICVPTALMNENYKVFVNGTEVPHTLLPCSNTTHNYIYFTYNHSVQEVVIIPEIPSFLILPLFMLATLLTVIVYRKKHNS